MQFVDSPSALPGSCFICGSADRKGFVDLGFSFDYHGAVYICVDECLRQMANEAKYLSPEQGYALKEALDLLQQQNKLLQNEVISARQALKETVNANSSASLRIGVDSDLRVFAGENPNLFPKGTPSLAPGEGIVDESGDEPRLAELRRASAESKLSSATEL